MSQKSQKGYSGIELLIVAMILILTGTIVIKHRSYTKYQADFKNIFGVEIVNDTSLNNDKIQLLEPLVISRLKELDNNLKILNQQRVALLTLPAASPAPSPGDVTQKINKLDNIKIRIDYASSEFARAKKTAEYFGFKVSP